MKAQQIIETLTEQLREYEEIVIPNLEKQYQTLKHLHADQSKRILFLSNCNLNHFQTDHLNDNEKHNDEQNLRFQQASSKIQSLEEEIEILKSERFHKLDQTLRENEILRESLERFEREGHLREEEFNQKIQILKDEIEKLQTRGFIDA